MWFTTTQEPNFSSTLGVHASHCPILKGTENPNLDNFDRILSMTQAMFEAVVEAPENNYTPALLSEAAAIEAVT